jgi:hypothetical protein
MSKKTNNHHLRLIQGLEVSVPETFNPVEKLFRGHFRNIKQGANVIALEPPKPANIFLHEHLENVVRLVREGSVVGSEIHNAGRSEFLFRGYFKNETRNKK